MGNDYYSQNSQTQQIPPRHAPRHSQQQYAQYEQPYQPNPQYQQPQYAPQSQMSMPPINVTGTGSWMLTLFLMCIPVINIILLFVWAFGSNTEPSKQNWARANLIWILVGIIAVVVFAILANVAGISLPDYLARIRLS